jgi:hypothetical protein
MSINQKKKKTPIFHLLEAYFDFSNNLESEKKSICIFEKST